MNILFFGKKRHGTGSHEYQRHVLRGYPIKGEYDCYGRSLTLNNQTYVFDRFDDMGNAVFVDDQWDEGDAVTFDVDVEAYLADTGVNADVLWGGYPSEEDRMADDGCPCRKE